MLSFFNARAQICHNIEQIHEIHEQFLAHLRTITPLSALPVPEGVSEILSLGLSKRLSTIDIPGLKGLSHRSLRAKKLKDLRTLLAEPSEVLDVAREIQRLVSKPPLKFRIRTNPRPMTTVHLIPGI